MKNPYCSLLLPFRLVLCIRQALTRMVVCFSIFIVGSIVCYSTLHAQTTYIWVGGSTGSWTTSTNWSPTRTTTATNDIILFSTGGTVTVTSLPTQTIGQLLLSNNTTVNLQAAVTDTLTLSGGAGPGLDVPSGSALNCNAANAITISLSTGVVGSISGSVTFSATISTAHRLTAVNAGSLTFNNGATFTAGTNFSGNAFGTTNLNSVVFAGGSIYIFKSGGNPFGATAPSSVVVFQSGSLFSIQANLTPSVSGRTYADIELNASGAKITFTGGFSMHYE